MQEHHLPTQWHCHASSVKPNTNTWKKCTHWFHVVAIHQWVVSRARDRMSTEHNSVRFRSRLQVHSTVHTHRSSLRVCTHVCVYSPHALLPLNYPCWSCSYPQTTYANKGWTITGRREGWPKVMLMLYYMLVPHYCHFIIMSTEKTTLQTDNK